MGIAFPQPKHVPCSECGEAVERGCEDEHACERERLLDYQMFQLREEIAAVTNEVAAYLETPQGRFELWCAERERTNENC